MNKDKIQGHKNRGKHRAYNHRGLNRDFERFCVRVNAVRKHGSRRHYARDVFPEKDALYQMQEKMQRKREKKAEPHKVVMERKRKNGNAADDEKFLGHSQRKRLGRKLQMRSKAHCYFGKSPGHILSVMEKP